MGVQGYLRQSGACRAVALVGMRAVPGHPRFRVRQSDAPASRFFAPRVRINAATLRIRK